MKSIYHKKHMFHKKEFRERKMGIELSEFRKKMKMDLKNKIYK